MTAVMVKFRHKAQRKVNIEMVEEIKRRVRSRERCFIYVMSEQYGPVLIGNKNRLQMLLI